MINTGTTIVTFLMVFLIQRTQNKDGLAIQLKLNELVAAMQGASNRLIEVEDLSEEELHVLTHTLSTARRNGARRHWTSPRRIRSKKPNRATPPNTVRSVPASAKASARPRRSASREGGRLQADRPTWCPA